MSDERERAYHGAPTVTPEREQAWQVWKDNYLTACIDRWIGQGGGRDEITHAAAIVLTELAEIDDLPWMPLGPALNQRALAVVTDTVLEGEAKTAYINSLRTAETSTPHERTQATAYLLGITVQQAAAMRDRIGRAAGRDAPNDGRTALYRHFDENGALLYIGIAKKPAERSEQHRYNSKWFRFVADTQVEWFATRKQAEKAERAAITAELPIFNQTHNKANRHAATEYLFGALEAAALAGSGAAAIEERSA